MREALPVRGRTGRRAARRPAPRPAAAHPRAAAFPGVAGLPVVAALFLAAALPMFAPAPVVGQEGEVRHPAVDSLFADLDRRDAPGAAVLVMKDGEVVHRAGHGVAHLEHGVPIGPSSVFDIASVAKQFAGMAVAMLIEEGALSPRDDVREHIPELEIDRPVTVEQLVHHTSGLRDWPGTLQLAGWDYGDIISFRQILEMAYNQEDLNFDPGDEYTYSNTGYNLLAELVSRATGEPFARWTRENIFEPLGMEDTHFHDDHERIVPNRAESYRVVGRDGGEPTFRRALNNLTALGSSSLFTTIDDLERWLRHLDDPAVGGARVVERMHRPGRLNSGDIVRYGYGLTLGEHRGLATAGHGGSWAGYRTHLLRYPDEGLAVVVLGNRSDLNAGERARRVGERFLGDRMDPPEAEPVRAGGGGGGGTAGAVERAALEPHELAEYEGVYTSSELDARYRLELRGGELVAVHFRRGEFELVALGPDLFVAGGLGRIDFVRNRDGEVEGFRATLGARSRGIRFERVP